MRLFKFTFPAFLIFSNTLIAQIDLSKYYDANVFRLSSTEYNQEKEFGKFKKVNPEDVDGFFERGVLKMESGLYKEAIKDFDQIIKLIPKYAEAYYLKGLCVVETEDISLAESNFKKAIEILPVFAQAYTQLGLIYWKKEDLKTAEEYFDKAYDLDNSDVLPLFYKCNIALYNENNIAKTKRLLNKIIKIDSTFSGAYFYKAAIKLAEGYNKNALKNFDEAINYNPNFIGAYLWRGFTYLLLNETENAENDFSILIELQPDESDFWALRSFLRIEKGEYKNAVDDMVHALKYEEIDSENYKGGRTSLSKKN